MAPKPIQPNSPVAAAAKANANVVDENLERHLDRNRWRLGKSAGMAKSLATLNEHGAVQLGFVS
jgi:hypothetical protein